MKTTGSCHCNQGERECLRIVANKLIKDHQQDGRGISVHLELLCKCVSCRRLSTHTSSMTEPLLPNKARQVSLFKPLATLEPRPCTFGLVQTLLVEMGGLLQGTVVVLQLLHWMRWCNHVLATAGTTKAVFPHRRQLVTGMPSVIHNRRATRLRRTCSSHATCCDKHASSSKTCVDKSL